MQKNTVKLLEFKLEDSKKEDVEKALADWLDEGFVIVAQHETDGYINFTLVRTRLSLNQMIMGGEESHDQAPPPKYKLENGAVVQVLH